MNYEDIKLKVESRLTPKRFKHVLGVVEAAKKLGEIYDESIEKVQLGAILHDYAKNMKIEELLEVAIKNNIQLDEIEIESSELIHGKVGAFLVKYDLKIEDEDILNAIENHTMGRKNMSKLEKIICLADYIEPGRAFPGVEKLRKLAGKDLDKALLKALDNTIKYLIEEGQVIHPRTLETRNYLLKIVREKGGE